jgi:branched-chain amino acid transport system substrate-binding protein
MRVCHVTTNAFVRRRALLLAVGVLVCATALGVTASPSSAATRPTVTIGVIAPLDAGLTNFGHGIRDSVVLAAKQANARGALKGWTVKVTAVDDSSDPVKGEAAARTLAADANVVAVIGPYNSGVAQKAAPILAAQGIPLISPGNTLTSLTVGEDSASPRRQWDTYFRLVGPDSRQAEFLASEAKRLGFEAAAVVSETKAVSQGLADEFVAAFEREGGTVAVQKTVPDGASAPEFTDFVTVAQAADPDLVFFGGEYQVAATLRTTATNAGLTAPMMGGDGMKDDAYIDSTGKAAKGSYATTVGVPLKLQPGAKQYLAAYRAARFSSQPSDFGPYAYDGANIVIDALARELANQSSLPEQLRANLVRDLQRTNRTGVTGKIKFDNFGDTVDPTFTLYKVGGSPLTWGAQTAK